MKEKFRDVRLKRNIRDREIMWYDRRDVEDDSSSPLVVFSKAMIILAVACILYSFGRGWFMQFSS